MSSSPLMKPNQSNEAQDVRSLSCQRSSGIVKEWLRAAGVAAALGGLYAWRGGASLLLLLLGTGLLMAGGLFLQVLGPRKIRLTRVITPAVPVAGERLVVKVRVDFFCRLPLPWMTVNDYWSGGSHRELLFPGFRRSFTYSYVLEGLSRGIHHLQGSSVVWGDLPGWFTGRCELKEKEQIRVQPVPLYFGTSRLGRAGIAGERWPSHQNRPGAGEIQDIRDYRPGDPQNRIHWKNSARRGSLLSRVPEQEKGRMVCVVLDNCARSYEVPPGAYRPRSRRDETPAAFEKAVSAAMGLMLLAEREGAYAQLYSGGWPEGLARHEGLGKLPDRVLDFLTEVAPGGTRPLDQLLEDASRSWIPGMTVAVITGKLEEEAAKSIAKWLVMGVKVEIYYLWDFPAPVRESSASQAFDALVPATVAASLARLGARIYCLDAGMPAAGHRKADSYELFGRPTLR